MQKSANQNTSSNQSNPATPPPLPPAPEPSVILENFDISDLIDNKD